MEHDDAEGIKAPNEVARRALALFAYVAVALGADRREIMEWLGRSDLARDLSPSEATFLANERPSERDVINASWSSERLVVLLWALGLSDLPEPDQQCDPSAFLEILPPFARREPDEIIGRAQLRDDGILGEMAERIWASHWSARDASLNGHEPSVPVVLGIIQERHHAINWLLGYDGAEWDDVTTDT